MQFLKMVPIVLRWLPHVVGAVSLIEVFASQKSGAEKKVAAMAWLQRTSDKMNLPWGPKVAPVVSGLIDAAVGIANLVGHFRHAERLAVPAVPDQELKDFFGEKR